MLVFIFNLTFSLRLYWEKNYLLDLLLYDTDYYGSQSYDWHFYMLWESLVKSPLHETCLRTEI